jgi:hypothetical protein
MNLAHPQQHYQHGLTEVEARIQREAQRFDLRPLVELLLEQGYAYEDIMFESSLEGRSSAIVKAVTFRRRPVRSVLVTVELGLLGDNSLLPSYFLHIAERMADSTPFFDFLRFFDHCLIENLFNALHPERGYGFASWRNALKSFLRMARPESPGTMHWLAQLYFPELRVSVTRTPFENATDQHACLTGISRLDGAGILGRIYVAESNGLRVDLVAEDEVDLNGRAWSDIVLLRLQDRLLPLLAPFRIPLIVRLVVLAHASWAHVDEPHAAEKGFLGYDRLRSKSEKRHTTTMFEGITGEERAFQIRTGS